MNLTIVDTEPFRIAIDPTETIMTTEHDIRMHTDRVMDSMLACMRNNDMRSFTDLFASDCVMDFPFAPPGYPTLHSRDDVWEYVKDYSSVLRIDEVIEHRRHHTMDPMTAIVEFSARGQALRTGNSYVVNYISVVEVGPDGIRRYSDYWNALAAASAIGGVESLMSAFAGPAT